MSGLVHLELSDRELIALLGSPMFGFPLAPWHRWFAWHPVWTVDHRFTWLRPCWRRRYQTKHHLPGPMLEWWTYARGDGYGLSVREGDRT